MGALNLIGGEKGGVGKSVMCRVLAQYFIDKGIDFAGFDTDESNSSFTRFYSDFVVPASTASYEGLDAVAEAFVENPDKQVLVDLAAQTLAPVSRWVLDSGLNEVLAEMDIGFNCWHVMDDGRESTDLLGRLFDTFGAEPKYFVVLNYGRGGEFTAFENSGLKQRAAELKAQIMELPKLHENCMRKIDLHDASFWAAVNNKERNDGTLGLLERQRVKVWLKKAYESIDKLSI